jgi:hypothetical protein
MFVDYLQVANGGIPEMEAYIPDISDYLVNKEDIEQPYYYTQLPDKFNEKNVEIFFIVAYGRAFTIQAAAVLVALPLLISMN